MYGVVGEKSIDFLKILYRLFRKTLQTFCKNSLDFSLIPYRLFPDTSVEPLGQHRSSAPFPLYKGLSSMGEVLCCQRINALFLRQTYSSPSENSLIFFYPLSGHHPTLVLTSILSYIRNLQFAASLDPALRTGSQQHIDRLVRDLRAFTAD